MNTVIDILLIIVAIIGLLGVNFLGYLIVSWKMLTISARITRSLWLLSSVLVTLSPFFIPIQIHTLGQMNDMKFGFPVHFVEQHFFAANADIIFPFYTTLVNGFGYSLRTTMSVNPLSYVIDLVLCYVVCVVIFRMLRKIMRLDHSHSSAV